MMRFQPSRWITLLLAVTTWWACSGTKIKPTMTTEERLALAEKMFKDGDYLEAQTQLRIIILNAPGSTAVDRAQFLLAETHYKLKEYVQAASEYEKLVRLYTRSEYLDEAQYKLGLCYYDLSPRSDLDQKYTLLAIDEFQKFLEDFADSPLVPEVTGKLDAAREKLARKEYNTAMLYKRMGYFDSALISFDAVLNTYYDTRFAEEALYYKAEALLKLQRPLEAAASLRALLEKYPKSKLRERAETMLKKVEPQPSADGSVKP